MSLKYFFQSNNFLKINGDSESQAIAVQHLVRPNEVERFVTRTPSPFVPRHAWSFAEQVAEWLRSRLSSGKLSYVPDPNGPLDYWSAPSHTLAWNGGDCEDLTILGVSLFAAVGMPAQVTVGTYWNGSSSGGHAWIEGQDERGFFLIEATSGDMYRWRPGNYLVTRWITPNLGRCVA
jgi:hypothetical protein